MHNILLVSGSETIRLMECLVVSSYRFYDIVFACLRFVLHYVERVQSRVEFSNQNLNTETNNFIVCPWCTVQHWNRIRVIRLGQAGTAVVFRISGSVGKKGTVQFGSLRTGTHPRALRRCTVEGNTARRFTARVCRRKTRGRRLSSTARTLCVWAGLALLP